MSEITPTEKLQRRINHPERALEEFKSQARLTEKQEEVFRRRKAGETFTSIAISMGVTPTAIRTIYLVAEKKVAELQRTVACPHCSAKFKFYDAI